MKISAVVNTYNEEKKIERCLQSITWADEIVVSDASSTDQTVELARKFTDRVIVHHDKSGFVEPQRNTAIAQASGDWILIVDADEVVPVSLAVLLRKVADDSRGNFVEIPRKNIIFNKWLKGSGWWPDYNIRFFKKGTVTWENKIHVPPKTEGEGQKLDPTEDNAIVHFHYETVSQYLERLDRYTTIQANELTNTGAKFVWTDFLGKPLSEFITRFFVWEGYKDGVHGLALSLLQSFSFLIVELKLWQAYQFIEEHPDNFLKALEQEKGYVGHELTFWFAKARGQGKIARLIARLK